jgi:hypothetical protein
LNFRGFGKMACVCTVSANALPPCSAGLRGFSGRFCRELRGE